MVKPILCSNPFKTKFSAHSRKRRKITKEFSYKASHVGVVLVEGAEICNVCRMNINNKIGNDSEKSKEKTNG